MLNNTIDLNTILFTCKWDGPQGHIHKLSAMRIRRLLDEGIWQETTEHRVYWDTEQQEVVVCIKQQ